MDREKRHVVVPIDFSEQSMLALDQAYIMARMINAEINLLHIIVETSPFWGIFTQKEQDDVIEKFKKKLDDFAEVVSKKSGLKVNTIVEQGKLIEKIIEVTDRLRARYLIVGTLIKDNFKEKIIGTNASKLVREANCPIITIKGSKNTGTCKKIVLPLDLTKETKEKVGHTITFAKYFKATVHAVTVATSKDSHLVARLQSQLEQVQKFIEKQGIECETKFIKAGASNEGVAGQLLSYAYEINADLMIIMTQQEDVITEQFVGSFAKAIINNSDIPVLSIAPRKK